MSTKLYILIVFLVIIGILSSFYAGFFIKDLITKPKANTTTVFSTEQKYKPNYIDEVIITTKEKPHKTLILSAIRTYKNTTTYTYIVKSFYFDGEKWSKQIDQGETPEIENIPRTPYVSRWDIKSDPSYMLRQSVSGEVNIANSKIVFNIPLFENEMGIRSDPKYTKFMSETDGTITIDSNKYDSYVVYSRIYSFNPPESLITTTDPSGIETEWLAFWDELGNFYSIDETKIDNKKTLDVYKAHSMALVKYNDSSLQKSFDLNLVKNGSDKYVVDILGRINKKISVQRLNSVNKSVNGKDVWNTGLVSGTIDLKNGKNINGFGIFEQISQ
jgi:hypothetical protein